MHALSVPAPGNGVLADGPTGAREDTPRAGAELAPGFCIAATSDKNVSDRQQVAQGQCPATRP